MTRLRHRFFLERASGLKEVRRVKSPASQKIEVWVVEDHDDARRAVIRAINRAPDLSCSCGFATCEEALDTLRHQAPPQVVLLDVRLPGMDGIEGIRRIKAVAPEVHVLMLTVYDDHEKVFSAICAGASGYLLKTDDHDAIINAIKNVIGGGAPMNPRVARLVLNMFAKIAAPKKTEYGLSEREREILELMVKGLIKKEIADQLKLSYHTVDNHLRSIYTKLHVHTRTGAVAKAVSERLLSF
ncbi:MAG: response regulator transcription factor [Verrucomicrobiota bacterium]